MDTISSNFAIFYSLGAILIMAGGYWHAHRADCELQELLDNAKDKAIDHLD